MFDVDTMDRTVLGKATRSFSHIFFRQVPSDDIYEP